MKSAILFLAVSLVGLPINLLVNYPRPEIIAAVAPARFLACIVAVEGTPANPYGLTPEVWRQEKMQGSYLCSPSLQEVCAHRHLRTLKDQIRGVHAHADVFELAVCWLRGFDGGMDVIEGDTNDAVARDYGSRVLHLYFDPTFEPTTTPTL